MARKSAIVLEDQRGAVVCRLAPAAAEQRVARGLAFWIGDQRLRLADRTHVGSGVDRGTKPTISARNLNAATDAWWNRARVARGVRSVEVPNAAAYHEGRIAAWPMIHDTRAACVTGARA